MDCLFCGTFNPIHNAHLRMAGFVLAEFGFERVIFIPSAVPPHKGTDIEPHHRLEMVKLAVEGNERFEVSDIEFRMSGKSYTYNTILALGGKYNFLIGTDAFEKIESWYEIDKLKKLLKFIVFKREKDVDVSHFDYLREKGFDFAFTSLDFCDISSTEIRKYAVDGLSLNGLVPKAVEDYIYANGLYRRN